MRIQMVTTAAGPQGVWPAGSIQVVVRAQGQVLVTHGYAVALDDVIVAGDLSAADAVEVAAVDPVIEVADAPAQAPKRRMTRRTKKNAG